MLVKVLFGKEERGETYEHQRVDMKVRLVMNYVGQKDQKDSGEKRTSTEAQPIYVSAFDEGRQFFTFEMDGTEQQGEKYQSDLRPTYSHQKIEKEYD